MRRGLIPLCMIFTLAAAMVPSAAHALADGEELEHLNVSGWSAFAKVHYAYAIGSDHTYVTCHIERRFGTTQVQMSFETTARGFEFSLDFSDRLWNFSRNIGFLEQVNISIDGEQVLGVGSSASGSHIGISMVNDLDLLARIAHGHVLRLSGRNLRLSIQLDGTYNALDWLWGCYRRYPISTAIHRYLAESGRFGHLLLDLQPASRDAEPGEAQTDGSDQEPQPDARAVHEMVGTGSGVVVSPQGHIVTNHHVVSDCRQVRVPGIGAAQLIADDPDADLALLQASGIPPATAVLSDEVVRAGDAVVVLGYPLAGLLATEMNVTTGNVSAEAGPGGDVRLMQFTAPVQPGSSGGPVMDTSGHLVGIVVSGLGSLRLAREIGTLPQNVNFAIKESVVRNFLEANETHYETALFGWQRSTAEIADEARDYTVLLECWR